MPVIQTLEGPRPRRQQVGLLGGLIKPIPIAPTTLQGLFGVFDPVKAHPLIFVFGIGAGIFLASRRKRR